MADQTEPGLTLTTLGVGAAVSPRFAPAGLLVELGACRIMLDGGPGSGPRGPLTAWLVTDERAELIARIRALGRALGVEPRMGDVSQGGLTVVSRPVVHTNHPTCGYLMRAAGWRVAWAPEFREFPDWARGVDLMFAEAAGWSRPIRFAGGVGGHLHVLAVAAAARSLGVRRLVFAHIGRPTIRAIDRGETPPFGEFAEDGQVFRLIGARRSGRGCG
ncbi:MAG TPA: MBL fold metallo-hydrolase [Candidatus Eisenbacteria bacterium]|nr:MBL fold metallo-hydrolase [Candidatus Eisenbacteria bacterium]